MRRVIAEIIQDGRKLCRKKYFSIGLVALMLLGFSTLLHNPTVGIDDTSFDVYYEDGVSPAMGRWCLYLINKVFPLAYNPYFVELAGLLCFCVSVMLWCLVMNRLYGESISGWGYLVFGGVMITSPIITEVVVWYLQDGIYLGYGFCALAVLAGMEAFRQDKALSVRARWGMLLVSACFLTVALGFYESFMIVYLMGMVMVFLSCRVRKNERYSVRPAEWFVKIAAAAAVSVLLRTLIVEGMIVFFSLEEQTKVLRSRGMYEFLGWFDGSKSFQDFVYVMKGFFVKYYINALVYTPVMILVLAVLALLLFALWKSIRCRDGWILASALGIVALPWIMPILEGVATYYRTSQYIPLLTAFAALLVAYLVTGLTAGGVRAAGLVRAASVVAATVLLYRQAYEMNRWLYLDAMKYEHTKQTLSQLALTIRQECDETKPLCVIGEYETPDSFQQEACCPSWSKKYQLTSVFVKALDESLFEEYNTPWGYAFAETPRLSFIKWGSSAFYGFDRELVKFYRMHGESFTEDGNLAHYEAARQLFEDGPAWPEKGSVLEMEDHIIVNFGVK